MVGGGAVGLLPEDLGMGRLFWRVREAVVAADADGERIVLWNPAAERLFGYSTDEALGMPLEALVPERLRAAHRAGLGRYRAGGGGLVDADAAVEVPALRKDGAEVPIELTLASAEAPDGDGRYVVAVIRDASERKQAEEEHRRLLTEQAARAEAEAALRLMDEFLAVAAHELKTPATVLRLTAQMGLRRLRRQGDLPADEAGRVLAAIDDHAARLAVLAGQLLDAARLEAGTLHLNAAEADATLLVGQAVRRLAPADRRRVVVDAPAPVPVTADPERLQQVVLGLLETAAKFSSAGTRIDVTVRGAPGGGATVAVRDRGPGVPAEARTRLFERFHRADPAAHARGMGLGLYLGRRLAELMGGTLEAAFPPAGGTVMTLRLPRRAGTEPTR